MPTSIARRAYCTDAAQYAFQSPSAPGPFTDDLNLLGARAGRWARSVNLPVQEAYRSGKYTVIVNQRYAVNLKGETPTVDLID
jgi:hypothetical protein